MKKEAEIRLAENVPSGLADPKYIGPAVLITGAAVAAENLPSGFTDPKYIGAAALATGVAVALDRFKSRHDIDSTTETAVPIADPESAEHARIDNKWSRLRDIGAYYLAIGFTTLVAVQAAGPYGSKESRSGGAAIIINANTSADSADMTAPNGSSTTRLDASIEGSIGAASKDNVQTSFILSGGTSLLADNTPATHKNLTQIRSKIYKDLKYNFRNGEASIADSVIEAPKTLDSTMPNSIVMISSALSSADLVNTRANIASIKQYYPKDKIYAVVVGDTTGSQQIGAVTVSSPVDVSSFQQLLGSQNVKSASSTQAVTKDVLDFINNQQAKENKKPINYIDFNLGTILGGLLAAAAVRRRLAGITKLKKLNTESDDLSDTTSLRGIVTDVLKKTLRTKRTNSKRGGK